MASKLSKNEQKCSLAVDKKSKYVASGFLYVGQDKTLSKNIHVSSQVVMIFITVPFKSSC